VTLIDVVLMAFAGLTAGTINAVVGSGTLITFPVLLAIGYPPVTANVSNSIGLAFGQVSSAIGYRAELAGQWSRLVRFGVAAATGGALGAGLLLWLPSAVFETVVPVLIVAALVLVLAQPMIARRLAQRRSVNGPKDGPLLFGALFAAGVYGGYFGAAQGVLLVGLMGVLLDESLQRINGIKNVLTAVANLVSGVVFVFIADVDWLVVLVIAVSSVIGGQLGAKVGRRLPAAVLRGVIVLVGSIAVCLLLIR